jgi:acetylornithine deacetylase
MTTKAVFDHIDDARLTQLLWDTVETYSPSYAEEAVVDFLAETLDEMGLSYELQRVSEEDETPERHNILVELGPASSGDEEQAGEPAGLVLVGHIDTIPAWDEESTTVEVEDDKMYGLGTADMKSGCCAMIEAMCAVARSEIELERGVILALVVGEEEYGDGSEFFLEDYQPGLTVIGEPTGLKPCIEHFGFAEFVLRCDGNPAHAAFPELGANAIHAMLGWLSRLIEGMHDVTNPDNKGDKQIAMNPRAISGGGDLFIVAEHCTAGVDVHLGPRIEHDEVIGLLDAARAEVVENHPDCQLSFEQTFYAPAYRLKADDPRLRPLEEAFEMADMEWKPSAFRSHSDGNMFRQRGALPVICGPGKLEVAHTRHEHVDLSELHQAARLYAAMIVAACC